MNGFIDEIYKDESPLKTVAHIKGILASNGIETEEIWMPTSVPYCSAVRVNVVGTTFGSNGKGLSKELALASGYGELMERLQLGYITGGMTQKDGNYCVSDGLSKILPARQLLEDDSALYQRIALRLEMFSGEKMTAEQLLLQYADSDGCVQAAPYFNITSGKTQYFPSEIRKRVYNANGCAAGNSMEEAIVQGISETVERNHQMEIIARELTPPDVPEEVLQKYTASYEIIRFVRSNGYKVVIKDCSLGRKFPVLCACIINEKTGMYHTHFGAYPVFEIALARTLTESFQGRNIQNIATVSSFLESREEACSARNIANEMGNSTGQKQLSFFIGQPQYPFNADAGFEGGNNKELLRECIAYFKEQDLELLVREGSCLGFPTYQILIPGYSELFIHRLLDNQDELKFLPQAVKTLRDPKKAKLQDIMGYLMHLARIGVLDKTVSGIHGFSASARLSTTLNGWQDAAYMALNQAHVYYTIGRKKEAFQALSNAMTLPELAANSYLNCLKLYLSLEQKGHDPRPALALFHEAQISQDVLEQIDSGKNPLDRFVLSCDGQCDEGCPLIKVCCQKRVQELSNLINQKTATLDFDVFTEKLKALL